MLRTVGWPLLLGLSGALAMLPARAESQPAKRRTPQQQERLKERDRLHAEAQKLYTAGSYADAIALAEKMLAIEREVFGHVHTDVAGSLNWLSEMYQYREDFAAARKAGQECLSIQTKLHGPDHWQTSDARRNLEYVDELQRLTADQRRLLLRAAEMMTRVRELARTGKYPDAVRLAKKALQLRESILGEDHPHVADTLHWLGWLYTELRDETHIESTYRRVLAIRNRRLGEKHPEYATALDNLASEYERRAEYARAMALRRQALEIRKETLGAKHIAYATSLHNLAFVAMERRDYPHAEALWKEVLQIKKELVGEKDPAYANSLGALASLYETMQDYPRAEALRRQVLQIKRTALGANHIECGRELGLLGALYRSVHDFDQAEACFDEALSIFRRALGTGHVHYVITLDHLAEVYRLAENYEKAEALYQQEIDLLKKLRLDQQPPGAHALNQLGLIYSETKQYAKAEACLQESLAINQKAVGEKDADYLITLSNLAQLYTGDGSYDRAVPLARRIMAARKALGSGHPDFRNSFFTLLNALAGAARMAEHRNDFAAARQFRREVLDLNTQVRGKDHWKTADARRELVQIDRLEQLAPKQRALLAQADQLLEKVIQLNRQNKRTEAIPLAQQIVEHRTAVLGEEDPRCGEGLLWLGNLLNWAHQYQQSEQPLRRAVAIYKQTLGVKHPACADALSELALSYSERREYSQAAAVYREALMVRKEVLQTTDPDYTRSVGHLAVTLANLALEQTKQDNLAAAHKSRQEVVALLVALRGEHHWQVTDAQFNLAYVDELEKLNRQQRRRLQEADMLEKKVNELYVRQRYREALPLAKQVFETRRELLGEAHHRTAWSVNDLGRVYVGLEDFGQAEPIRRRNLQLIKRIYGEKHPYYATSLHNLAGLYDAMAQYIKAEPLYRQALAIRKELLGEDHREYIYCLNDLALNCGARGDRAQEEFLLRQALVLRKRTMGRDAEYAVNLGNLAVVYDIRGEQAGAESLFREAGDILRKAGREQDPRYAWILECQATLYKNQRKLATSEGLYRQALAIYAEAFGKESATYGKALSHLAHLCLTKEDYRHARPLFEEALRTLKRAYGEKHPAVAETLDSFGWLHIATGEYARAEALFRQALKIRKSVLGENHPEYAESLRSLGWLYQQMRDYSRAEPPYRQGLAILKRAVGERHPGYSKMLDEAGGLYLLMGDNEQALAMRRLAAEIDRQILGEKDLNYAASLSNLALVYMDMNDTAQAERLYRQALDIHQEVGADRSAAFATSLQNLGSLYSWKANYAAAEPLLRQAVQLRRQLLGEKHPQYALALYHLGCLHCEKGRYEDAERLLRQSLAIYKEVLGEQAPASASCLQELAQVCALRGDCDQAEALSRQGLEMDRKHLEQSAVVQSERQQLAAVLDLRHRLDKYLAFALRSRAGAEHAYEHVLAWKGAVSTRQSEMRVLRRPLSAGGGPEVSKTYGQLVQATTRLAALSNATPDPQEPDRLLRDLEETSKEIEGLEKRLADISAAFRAQQQLRRRTASDIRTALPPDTVLIDLLEYWDFDPQLAKQGKEPQQRRFVACVVRPDDSRVAVVDLGPAASIRRAVAAWRLALQRRFRTEGDSKLYTAVRRILWEPLAPHVQGAKTILISPDGALARIPWAALPGQKPGTYLIEDMALAVVPVPARLPELLATDRSAHVPAALLLVGDVRFDAAPGQPADSAAARAAPSVSRGDSRIHWPALPGTGPEVEAIKKTFQGHFRGTTVTELRQADATESAVRREACRHSFLHFATHGYFAPAQLRSALAAVSQRPEQGVATLFGRKGVSGFHPGLLSGVVLAGANEPLDPEHDDGILTALEVETLELTAAELVTLSACETGLGEEAGGEGLLGLQRSFQVAGARSVLAGLWQVDDAATRKLMTEFYTNLWQKKMSRLEALRQAQLWMLREGESWMQTEGLSRGMVDVRVPKERLPIEDGRLAPYYWAAFSLSGDWR